MARTDSDGRFRSTYTPYADNSRLRSSSNPLNTGGNGQNVDREARDAFIPDTGCVFLGVDLSLAEDRDTKVRTKAPRLIELARTPPWEADFHKQAACKIFRKYEKDITKDERYIGKRAKHDSNYSSEGMGGAGLSDALLKEGYTYTPEECQEFIDSVREPEVLDWHRQIRQQIMRSRTLTNAWGRSISYEYERLDPKLYHRAYAFLPSSDIAMLMTQWGLLALDAFIEKTDLGKTRINQDGHDSLLISVEPKRAYYIATFLKGSLERVMVYDGTELSMYCEFSLGSSWMMEHEWKRMPKEKEFVEVAHSLLKETK